MKTKTVVGRRWRSSSLQLREWILFYWNWSEFLRLWRWPLSTAIDRFSLSKRLLSASVLFHSRRCISPLTVAVFTCIFAIFISDFVRKRPIFTLPCTFDSIPISLDARSHGAVAVVGGLSFRLIGWTETFSVKETVSQQCNRTDCRRNAKERAWHGQRQPKWYVAYENTGIQQFLHLKFLIYFIWGSLTIDMHSADQKKSELILLAFPFIGIIAWAVGFWNCFLNFSFKLKE